MGSKRGQTWSLDLILASGIFILFIIGFYVVLSDQAEPNAQSNLEDNAQQIATRLDAKSGNVKTELVKDGSIDEQKLSDLSNTEYNQLKKDLGTSSDFCIFIEDENGRLIPINNSKIGIGGSEILINGIPCNGTIN